MKAITNFDVALMDDLMDGITQTDLWNQIQQTDPMLLEADKQLDDALAAVKTKCTDEELKAISDAASAYGTALDYAAIMYGIHVADTIRSVCANPSDVTRYIMQRTGREVPA